MGLKKKVTTKDIADHVGLSQSAVSMILNNKTNVSFSDSTRQKVLDAAKELGYQKKKKSSSTEAPIFKIFAARWMLRPVYVRRSFLLTI